MAQQKDTLGDYVLVARAIFEDPKRMRVFLKMMGSQEGAVQAVQTVMAAIEQKRPIPADIAPMLAVACYFLMVGIAQESTGIKANTDIMRSVIDKLRQGVAQTHPMSLAGASQQPQKPSGLIQQSRVS